LEQGDEVTRLETEVLVVAHPVDDPDGDQDVEHGIDGRRRDRDDHTPVRFGVVPARLDDAVVFGRREVLERRQHRHCVERPDVDRKILGESPWDEAVPVRPRLAVELGVDAHAGDEVGAERSEQRSVVTAHIEDAGPAGDSANGLGDPQITQEAVDVLHSATRR